MIDESQAPAAWAKFKDEAEARWKTTVSGLEEGPGAVDLAKAAALTQGRELARQWTSEMPRLAADEDTQRQEFDNALRATWGRPLDLLTGFIIAATCFGDDFAATQPRDNRTDLTEVLLTLHAAACSTAREVLWLLQGGYPVGAEARSRTLHETAVVALVLAQKRDDPDLLKRFFTWAAVEECRYWTYLAKHSNDIGAPTLGAEDLAALAARVDDLEAEYGPGFKKEYGWAAHLCDSEGLGGLEKLVKRRERHPFFKLASSNAIHVNPNTISRHYVQRAGGPERLSNATITGFGRPAVLTAYSLFDVCDAILDAGQRSDGYGLPIAFHGVAQLRDAAVEAFSEVDDPG
jgi:hypothetical protein